MNSNPQPNDLDLEALKQRVATIPDFPQPGILFRDITTLVTDSRAFRATIDHLAAVVEQVEHDTTVDQFAAVEARGFVFATALGYKMAKPVILVRKPGKLPRPTLTAHYELEYGQDSLEVHIDDITPHSNVVIIDDLLATGGTVSATAKLLRSAGATVNHAVFVINLPEVAGANHLASLNIATHSLIEFEGH